MWAENYDLTLYEVLSYKRSQGLLCTQGAPIRELVPNTIRSGDGSEIWYSKCKVKGLGIVDPNLIQPGCPSDRFALYTNPLDFFISFISDNVIRDIVTHTNSKIDVLRNKFMPSNSDSFTYSTTNLTELKCFIECLMSGVRKDNHLNLPQMFTVKYNCNFYRSVFFEKRFQFQIRSLRYDDDTQRAVNLVTDPFTHIRVV